MKKTTKRIINMAVGTAIGINIISAIANVLPGNKKGNKSDGRVIKVISKNEVEQYVSELIYKNIAETPWDDIMNLGDNDKMMFEVKVSVLDTNTLRVSSKTIKRQFNKIDLIESKIKERIKQCAM